MYNSYFGLAKKPFGLTADPGFLYLTSHHREALAGLLYAIHERKGFVVLASEAGMGKTTLLSTVLRKFEASLIHSSVILNPTVTAEEFLELALMDFGITQIPTSKALRLHLLHRMLMQTELEGRIAVLFVDEAHKLSTEVLEEVRLLSNFERADRKLLQIVLSGQKELADTLDRPELWQLKQRVALRMAIEPLGAAEVERYIQHRWTVAGGTLPAPFEPAALERIVLFSRGIPRVINVICDNALTLAFADEQRVVTSEHVMKACLDLHLKAEDAPGATEKPTPAVAVEVAAAATQAVSVTPVNVGTVLRTLDRYDPKPKKTSRWSRWFRKPVMNVATTEQV
jgi:general secretion pathway protein A